MKKIHNWIQFFVFICALVITAGAAVAENEIQITENPITINGVDYDYSTDQDTDPEINISPGDRVEVTFTYNNTLDRIIGNVMITATSNTQPDFIDYEDSDWALLPNTPTSHTFSFTVPYDIAGDDFEVTLRVADEDAEGNPFSDEVILLFEVVRDEQNVHVSDINVTDSTLTCTRRSDVTIDLINTGEESVHAEAWIFHGAAMMDEDGDFDRQPEFGSYTIVDDDGIDFNNDGDFNDFGEIPPLGSGEQGTLTIPNVNFSSLSTGASNIFVYRS